MVRSEEVLWLVCLCVVERVGRCTAVSSSCLISPAETDMLAHLVFGCVGMFRCRGYRGCRGIKGLVR